MNVDWYINRLKAMSCREVLWRFSQYVQQKRERKQFSTPKRVDENLFFNVKNLAFDWEKLSINLDNTCSTSMRTIDLLGSYKYEDYRTKWHAGFQTDNTWPLKFSYDIEYKGCDEVGDARTNWELNRCSQFALLAKDWYTTKEISFFEELEELEDSWSQGNPFLYGISWTSTMEFAIRAINWIYTAAFLSASNDGSMQNNIADRVENLARKFSIGAANMASYVALHYSRYSSANNHVIVEACCLGLAGIVYGINGWVAIADKVLDKEIVRQNHVDGVNKEQSLHYQIFFMEAVGLYIATKRNVGADVPELWQSILVKMCNYVQDCRIADNVWLEFGDNDEGLILNLCGEKPDIYEYGLQLMGIILDVDCRWSDYSNICETISWLFTCEEIEKVSVLPLRDNSKSATYSNGGVSIIRSENSRVVLGIDHGPLGFGSIAAHGHADALSLQLYVNGECLIGDPGTYIYHCSYPIRNELRSTCLHSTVCIDGKDQSEMLGAFMWGKRAQAKLISKSVNQYANYVIEVSHDGYDPIIHYRKIIFNGLDTFIIEDTLSSECNAKVIFIVPGNVHVSVDGHKAILSTKSGSRATIFAEEKTWNKEPVIYSASYASLQQGLKLSIPIKKSMACRVVCE